MRRISRILLGLLTTSIPVVIAACYGMMYAFSQRGKVIDKDTKAGVAGLRVECRNKADAMTARTHTGADGTFGLHTMSHNGCLTIAVDDERESGARYRSATVESDSSEVITIEVSPL